VAIGAYENDGNGNDSGHVRVYSLVVVNNIPVAVADTKTVDEDSSLTTINVIANDTDEDGDELSLIAATTSGTGTVAVNSDGLSVDYTPAINFNGTEAITYSVSDGFATVNGTLTITVTPVNDPVIASNVSAATVKNTNATIHLVASDIDFDDLTYTIVSNLESGTASLSGDKVTYTPASDVSGTVTFTFKVNDGTVDSETKTVTVKIIEEYLDKATQIGSDIDGKNANDASGSISFNEDNTIMAVGAYANDGNGNNSGHVRVYQYSSDSWTQLGADINGEAAGDNSGLSVSLSSDGTTVAIGAYGNDGNGNNSGHVRVYKYNGTAWTQLGSDIDGEAANDNSGYSVSLSSDGTTIAIGAYLNDDNGNDSGHVRVYQYSSNVWTQLGLDIDGDTAGDRSGYSVSLSSDGTIVAIGAYLNDDNGNDSGHVRVYQYSSNVWTQLGLDIDGDTAGDRSGYSVSLSSDGTTVAIGAIGNDVNGSNSGHVRIYSYNGSAWTQLGTDIDGEAAGDQSGYFVSLSSDGNTLAIGAPSNDGNGSGSGNVRVYNYNGSAWTQLGTDIDGEAAGDQSGYFVSLSSDGTTVAIGANLNADNGTDSGHVRVYNLVDLKSINLDNDKDGDTILDDDDNCPTVANTDQSDIDGDGTGDVCDEDIDGDGLNNSKDNCPNVKNPNQEDMDGDGIGDVCDDDKDGDGKLNVDDNCPNIANADQADMDGDGIGDVCDDDKDGDGKLNVEDNCPNIANSDQADIDGDGIGDVCDDDKDGDGKLNDDDNCPNIANADQADMDDDGIGDVCDDSDGDQIVDSSDNCPTVANADQADMDDDGIGDVCDEDIDGDGKLNVEDNCPNIANADQADMDDDGIGDVCDEDIDGDTILNDKDNCPLISNTNQLDKDKDGKGDVCDPYFNLNQNNNKVSINRASCIGSNDGSIGLSIEDNSFDYSITVTGINDPIPISGENKTASVTGLSVGTYSVCFKVLGQLDYEQCFEVVIGEPKPISAFIDVDNDNRTTNIQLGGSKNYNIDINGKRHQVTGDNFTTTLKTGLSIIRISTSLDCQGVIEREVFISEDIHYYPNPTNDDVSVHIGGEDNKVMVSVFSEKGDLIYLREQLVQDISRLTEIDLSFQITGTYIVTLEGPTVRKTFKIVKK
jgi:hypothetical protein